MNPGPQSDYSLPGNPDKATFLLEHIPYTWHSYTMLRDRTRSIRWLTARQEAQRDVLVVLCLRLVHYVNPPPLRDTVFAARSHSLNTPVEPYFTPKCFLFMVQLLETSSTAAVYRASKLKRDSLTAAAVGRSIDSIGPVP